MEKLEITHRGIPLEIAYFIRRGKKETVLYLHGLGCSKSDFLQATEVELLHDHTIIALDFPGHGNSAYLENLGIDDLIEITHSFAEKLKLNNIVLIGFSLGGLVALLFAEKYPEKVKAFINIEGNLAYEDCFFSRQVSQVDFGTFERETFPNFKLKLGSSENRGFRKYVELIEKYQPTKAFYEYCPSLVKYSDQGDLINKFLSLKIPKLFIHGAENNRLSYIPGLKKAGCEVVEIAGSNHFIQHDNPSQLYEAISSFIKVS